MLPLSPPKQSLYIFLLVKYSIYLGPCAVSQSYKGPFTYDLSHQEEGGGGAGSQQISDLSEKGGRRGLGNFRFFSEIGEGDYAFSYPYY